MIKGVAHIWMPVEDIDRAVDLREHPEPTRSEQGWAEVDASGLSASMAGILKQGAFDEAGPET